MRLHIQVSMGKLWAFGLATLMLLAMNCADRSDGSPIGSIRIMDSQLGEILTDGNGRSLYIFAGDAEGISTCTGACLELFTVYSVNNFTSPNGVPSAYFDEITRYDGQVQVTYKGWPLYHFTDDSRIGDVIGDGKDGTWFVARIDYDVMIAEQMVEGHQVRYLVDGFGNSLYHWNRDGNDESNCVGACITARPLFSSPDPVLPSTISKTDFNQISTNNKPQTTFKRKPLYYFVNDGHRGEINGHGTNGEWFLEDIQ